MVILSDSNDSINRVLGIEIQYEVPLYQRRYVWDKTNWETIWGDIFDQAKLNPAERGEGHFTGPIVTRRIAGERNRYEVIDGQQRLTTFEIIFCVIRDLCSGLTYLRNEDVIEQAEGHVLYHAIHKLIPTVYDRLAFEKIVEGRYGEELHKAFDVNNNCLIDDEVAEVRLQVFDQTNVSDSILGAYCHFYEEIRNYAQEDSEKISNLISAIKNDFKLIHLSLSETEQAEKIFESINATGRMLSNFDYLRNNLFLRARNLGKNEDGKFYRDIFYEDSDYWRFENESNYWSAEILESFLRAFLMATWNPKCFEEKNTKPFGEYQKYSKSLEKTQAADEQRIRYEFQQLSGWAKSYRALQDDPDFDIYVRFREDLSLSDDLDSLLLFVKHNCPDQLDVIYEILESYIVRRVFVLENAAYNHAQIIADSYTYINSFFSAVVTGGVPFSIGSFAQFLRNENWPENQDILDAFNQLNSKNVDFIAYLFREIVEWDKKRTLLYGREPLRLGAHKDLLERIQHLLDKDPGRLMETFNEIWPPPFHFTQNF